jgi:hypothetical protein
VAALRRGRGNRGVKVVLVGDFEQVQSIETGPGRSLSW